MLVYSIGCILKTAKRANQIASIPTVDNARAICQHEWRLRNAGARVHGERARVVIKYHLGLHLHIQKTRGERGIKREILGDKKVEPGVRMRVFLDSFVMFLHVRLIQIHQFLVVAIHV